MVLPNFRVVRRSGAMTAIVLMLAAALAPWVARRADCPRRKSTVSATQSQPTKLRDVGPWFLVDGLRLQRTTRVTRAARVTQGSLTDAIATSRHPLVLRFSVTMTSRSSGSCSEAMPFGDA